MYLVIDLAGNATHEGTVQLLDRSDLVDPHLKLDLTTQDSSGPWVSLRLSVLRSLC